MARLTPEPYRSAKSLMIVLVVAAVARGLHLWHVQGDALHAVLIGDERLYSEWSSRLLSGGWAAGDSDGDLYGGGLYHSPGYAWFLAAIRGLFGNSDSWVRLIQAVLGVATSGLVAVTGRRLFGALPGLVAGIGYGLFAPALFFEATLHKPALAQLFVALATYMLVLSRSSEGRTRWFASLGFGLAVGAGALVQEIVVALLPFAVALAPGGTQERLRGAGTAALGLALAMVPMALRNAAVKEPLLDRTHNMGMNLWIGSGQGADGFYRPLVPGRSRYSQEREDANRIARAALGGEPTEAEVSTWWRDRALTEMASAPVTTLGLVARKLGRTMAAEEWTDSRAYGLHRDRSWLLGVLGSAFHFGWLAALALGGVLRRWREPRLWVPTVGAAATVALGLSLFFVFGRLRLVLVPLMMPLAADTVVAGIKSARARKVNWRVALPVLVAFLLTLLPRENASQLAATTLANASEQHADEGRMDAALELAKEAALLDPTSGIKALHLGVMLARTGDFEVAKASLQKAAELDESLGFRAYLVMAEFAIQRNDRGAAVDALRHASEYVTMLRSELELAAEFSNTLRAPAAAAIFMKRAEELP